MGSGRLRRLLSGFAVFEGLRLEVAGVRPLRGADASKERFARASDFIAFFKAV